MVGQALSGFWIIFLGFVAMDSEPRPWNFLLALLVGAVPVVVLCALRAAGRAWPLFHRWAAAGALVAPAAFLAEVWASGIEHGRPAKTIGVIVICAVAALGVLAAAAVVFQDWLDGALKRGLPEGLSGESAVSPRGASVGGWHRHAIALGFALVCLALAPLALVEGLYRYGLAEVDRLPDPSAPAALPELMREAIWLGEGEPGPRVVQPLWPWTIVHNYWTDFHAIREHRRRGGTWSGGGQEANQVALMIEYDGGSPRDLARWSLTEWITRHWTAEQLIDAISERAYFGPNLYGVEQAAAAYFGKPVDSLSPDEIALIAGIRQNPHAFNPACHVDVAKRRRDFMLRALKEAGAFSEQDYALALSRPVNVLAKCPKAQPDGNQPSAAPNITDGGSG